MECHIQKLHRMSAIYGNIFYFNCNYIFLDCRCSFLHVTNHLKGNYWYLYARRRLFIHTSLKMERVFSLEISPSLTSHMIVASQLQGGVHLLYSLGMTRANPCSRGDRSAAKQSSFDMIILYRSVSLLIFQGHHI